METKYGILSENQIALTKRNIRSEIFFILRLSDPETKDEYKDKNIDVVKTIIDLLYKIGGLNSILQEPKEIVTTMSLLETAHKLYPEGGYDDGVEFKKSRYRKLILDAGAEVLKIKEV